MAVAKRRAAQNRQSCQKEVPICSFVVVAENSLSINRSERAFLCCVIVCKPQGGKVLPFVAGNPEDLGNPFGTRKKPQPDSRPSAGAGHGLLISSSTAQQLSWGINEEEEVHSLEISNGFEGFPLWNPGLRSEFRLLLLVQQQRVQLGSVVEDTQNNNSN